MQTDLQMIIQALILLDDNKIADINKLNLSQYAWKKQTTISALVDKWLILKSSKIKRDEYLWLVSNTTAYYDHRIKQIREVILMTHKVNRDRALMLIKTLRQMKTHVQTRYDIAKKGDKSTEDYVQYDTGQWNIISVFICQFGTSIMFYILD